MRRQFHPSKAANRSRLCCHQCPSPVVELTGADVVPARTSVGEAPDAKLSAAIVCFCSTVQRRRRSPRGINASAISVRSYDCSDDARCRRNHRGRDRSVSSAKRSIPAAVTAMWGRRNAYPPSTAPVVTPAIEQEARELTSQQSGDSITQWINAYKNAYSRGMPPIYCNAILPCLEGARDYAVTVGMEGIAAEATRYANTIPRVVVPPVVPAQNPKQAAGATVSFLNQIQSLDGLWAFGKNFGTEHPFWSGIILVGFLTILSGVANSRT